MKQSWTNGLIAERAIQIKADFKGSYGLRERLSEMLTDKINTSNKQTRNKDNYAMAGWAYLQADAVGYERALNEVISLILEKEVE